MLAGSQGRYAEPRMTDPLNAAALTLRRATPADADGIGDVWLASWRVT